MEIIYDRKKGYIINQLYKIILFANIEVHIQEFQVQLITCITIQCK